MTTTARFGDACDRERRAFLGSIVRVAALGLLANVGLAPSASAGTDPLRAALREQLDPAVAALGVRLPGWSRSRAEAVLLAGLDADELAALVKNDEALVSHLARRARQDFQAGRHALFEGWLLSHTELAVAVLVASPGGRSPKP